MRYTAGVHVMVLFFLFCGERFFAAAALKRWE
jgi:hypothetical protein